MSKGKPVVGPGMDEGERQRLLKMCDETTEAIDKQIAAQPSPPTERPDVEGIREEAEKKAFEWNTHSGFIFVLCDYALDVEKRLEGAHNVIFEAGRAHATIFSRQQKADSLLADLVEAVEKARHTDKCEMLNRKDLDPEWCDCNLEERLAAKKAALTAAKQYRESGEEGKKK